MDHLHENMASTPRRRPEATLSTEESFVLDGDDRKYSQQYYSMYQYRLGKLKTRVDENAMYKWGNGTKKIDGQTVIRKEKILDIVSGQLCWVSGTVFCDLAGKLNILDDVEKGNDDVIPPEPPTYRSENHAVVMLEDESGRAVLHNDVFLEQNVLVTGAIVAVLGVEIQAGIFEIVDVVYPSVAPQKPILNNSGKIALVSGLGIDSDVNYSLRVELLKQYLTGELGGVEGAEDIFHVVLCGDSVTCLPQAENIEFGSKNTSRFNANALQVLTTWLTDVIASVPVTIMPGSSDPAELCLPQQPLHPSLFGPTRQYANLARTTNPAWLDVGGVRLLGTLGQNIDDMRKYVDPAVPLQSLLEACMRYQHFVPTAPDTLYCYPFEDADPFVLEETPHVYFVGNQTHLSAEISLNLNHLTESTANVRLIGVPKFAETGQVVLLDTATLTTTLLTIA